MSYDEDENNEACQTDEEDHEKEAEFIKHELLKKQ